jgi:hypothetical protein
MARAFVGSAGLSGLQWSRRTTSPRVLFVP